MLRKLFLLAAVVLSLPASALEVSSLKTNHLECAAGVGAEAPVFSWVGRSSNKNGCQSAYQVRVWCEGSLVWDSGKVLSDNSITVRYEGQPLQPASLYTWQVRIWDNLGKASRWSGKCSFVTALFAPLEWSAQWIEPETTEASPILRKEFSIRKKVQRAVLYATAHGVYEASVNGRKVGDAFMTPGYTSYDNRLQYQTYDITSMLAMGNNAIGVEMARGWYLSNMGFVGRKEFVPNFEGSTFAFLGQIAITYTDGSREIVATDGSWRCSTGAVLHSAIYDGETFDARCIKEGWNKAGFDDSGWNDVKVADYGYANLVSQENGFVRNQEYVEADTLFVTPAGELVIDFGQNLVGSEEITFKGKAGQTIKVTHAEVLDENGNFYTHNLRSADAASQYVCDGTLRTYSTKFTFYGFRYIRLEGVDASEINLSDIRAAVRFTDMAPTGGFSCSDPLVNQLQSNVQWGLRGNFVDVPTDCPQRDERLGWTGDAEVFARTATFNRDAYAFYSKWLKDLEADQLPTGEVTDIVPFVKGLVGAGHVGWADAATIIPWTLYMAYGDTDILRRQYSSMKRWVDCIISQVGDDYLWNTGWHYGDWLFYSENNDCAGNSAVTYTPLCQQCHFANSADIVARTATVLGYSDDAAKYNNVAAKAREAFAKAYMTPSGMLVSHTQTAYTLALVYNMVPAECRPLLAANLDAAVKRYGHITTGFLGTSHISTVLTQNGYNNTAYDLLWRQQYPGWLYPVTMGATTIWERWNSMMPDHTIPDNGMNSFNHYSYGSIGDWLYREAAGLKESMPGYKTIEIRPHPGYGFSWMEARQITPYGEALSRWSIGESGELTLEVEIPFNTSAMVYVPVTRGAEVRIDGMPAEYEIEDGYAGFGVGSGHYVFNVR
ncbi:MAG: family 78 glycoside hydrolase catalytic domain [Bacteroidales bacterium]|nr:family 78 glycoside hydrolase catalytic domain [Bacteroidales bacterium]